MGSVTFDLPNNISVEIQDQNPGTEGHDRLDTADTIIIRQQISRANGSTITREQEFHPGVSSNQFTDGVWSYLNQVLRGQSLPRRVEGRRRAPRRIESSTGAHLLYQAQSLSAASEVVAARMHALEQAQQGHCETSDEAVRGGNSVAMEAGLPTMSYSDLPTLARGVSEFLRVPTRGESGEIQPLIRELLPQINIQRCADRQRVGAYSERIELHPATPRVP